MHPWFSWIRWLNPVYYAFESLLTSEWYSVMISTCVLADSLQTSWMGSSLDAPLLSLPRTVGVTPILVLGRLVAPSLELCRVLRPSLGRRTSPRR
jgi:hypothetical protein